MFKLLRRSVIVGLSVYAGFSFANIIGEPINPYWSVYNTAGGDVVRKVHHVSFTGCWEYVIANPNKATSCVSKVEFIK